MNKMDLFTFLLLVAFGVAACSTGNTQEQQRSHSREAQGELSNSIQK